MCVVWRPLLSLRSEKFVFVHPVTVLNYELCKLAFLSLESVELLFFLFVGPSRVGFDYFVQTLTVARKNYRATCGSKYVNGKPKPHRTFLRICISRRYILGLLCKCYAADVGQWCFVALLLSRVASKRTERKRKAILRKRNSRSRLAHCQSV